MHRPRPVVTGVNVTLSVVDPNGDVFDIGTATSDSTGYYSFVYTPDVAGTYNVTATFAGTKDYYPSVAETAFAVAEAPEPTPTPEPTPAPMTDTYILGAAGGIIAAIAIITVVIAIMLRKR
jgi:hypothetical protein